VSARPAVNCWDNGPCHSCSTSALFK
jgi:hypothetical protein